MGRGRLGAVSPGILQAPCRAEPSSTEPCRGRALRPCLREESLLRCRPPVPPPASRARPGTAAFSRAEPSRAEPRWGSGHVR